jgi:hypothetical protein
MLLDSKVVQIIAPSEISLKGRYVEERQKQWLRRLWYK